MPSRRNSNDDTDGGGKRSKRSGRGAQAGFRGFINANPSTADKSQYDAWLAEEGIFLSSLGECLERGFKLTVSYERNGDYFRATLATWDADSPNAGIVLSLRAGRPDTAIQRAVFWLTWKLGYALQEPDARTYDQDAW